MAPGDSVRNTLTITGPRSATPQTIEVLDCSPPSTREAVTSLERAAYLPGTVCPEKAGSTVLLTPAAWACARPWMKRHSAAT
ncbi:MAG: hypothetical protein BWY91_02534 [bacterium ADurb.BinA028]|nr:MAG: hypothetical protein BWY91_02534 [bacterium ADurb.BinA028]